MENTKNISENIQNGSPLELESMLKNAIRFYGGNGKHNIKPKTVYALNMQFIVDANNVMIKDLIINENCNESIIPESTTEEKYDEYNSLMNTPEMNRKTLGDVIKRKLDDLKIELTRKKATVPLI